MVEFLCTFLRRLVDHLALHDSVFSVLWRIKISRTVRFFTWQVPPQFAAWVTFYGLLGCVQFGGLCGVR